MFKIVQKDDYANEQVKIHYVSTREVAEEVKLDLEQRFGEMIMTEEESDECNWDPGGMLMTGDETFYFPLQYSVLTCKAQHFEYFASALMTYAPRGDTGYIKLHGRYFCICITGEEFSALKSAASDPDLSARAEEAWLKREAKLNKLAGDGLLARVVRGEDGQLYNQFPVPIETDPKKLN